MHEIDPTEEIEELPVDTRIVYAVAALFAVLALFSFVPAPKGTGAVAPSSLQVGGSPGGNNASSFYGTSAHTFDDASRANVFKQSSFGQ